MMLKILIVEDDPMMRLGLAHSLGQQAGITLVGEAHDGYQGLALAHEHQPDLILMDVGMPLLDGIAAT